MSKMLQYTGICHRYLFKVYTVCWGVLLMYTSGRGKKEEKQYQSTVQYCNLDIDWFLVSKCKQYHFPPFITVLICFHLYE